MKYLITGHTGFKGAWLSLILKRLGHEVSGISLAPKPGSIFEQGDLGKLYTQDLRIDIRQLEPLKKAIGEMKPDVVIHLAAQPLVRESYQKPQETFDTNVMGTINLLESTREVPSIKATLIITTDKVYRNTEKPGGYVESDPLGGDDPYSASKAAADIAAQGWIKSFSNHPIAIARAGNVIGAGDWAEDRLIPDLMKSSQNQSPVVLRFPNAVRPWQHVLDCLSGYLALVEEMLSKKMAGEWNFGPDINSKNTVLKVVEGVSQLLENPLQWSLENSDLYESNYLLLDSAKSLGELNWRNRLNFEQSLSWTVSGYQQALTGTPITEVLTTQISKYLELK